MEGIVLGDDRVNAENSLHISTYEGPRLLDNPISNFNNNQQTNQSVGSGSPSAGSPHKTVRFTIKEGSGPMGDFGKFSKAMADLQSDPWIEHEQHPAKLQIKDNSKRKSNLLNLALFDSNSVIKDFLLKQRTSRFIDKLRMNVGMANIKKINDHAINLINDLSYFRSQEPQEKQNKKPMITKRQPFEKRRSLLLLLNVTTENKILKYLWLNLLILFELVKSNFIKFWNYFEDKVPTIKPMSKIKLFWDFTMLSLIFWHLFSLSLLISFDISPWESYSFGLKSLQLNEYFHNFMAISTCLFIFDMLVKFNTACFEGGSEIYKKSKIVRNYFKKDFPYDLMGLSPFIVFYIINESQCYGTFIYYFPLILFKIQPLLNFLDNIKEGLLSFEGRKEAIYLLLKLMSEVFIVFHLFACFWHYTANTNVKKTWITYLKIEDFPWEEKYIKAIYYVVVTMTTTGYGDITPQNRAETLLSIICMFLGSVLVGYSINSIGEILDNMQADSKVSRKKMQTLNSFMSRNSLDYDLQVKIRKYLEYVWGKNLEQDKKSLAILAELPSSLREEALISSQGRFLTQNSLFSHNYSEQTLAKLAPLMNPVHLSPEEWVFIEGDEDDSIFIVNSGKVEIVALCEKRGFSYPVMSTITPGNCFGEYSFFTGFPRELSARAQGVCTLFKIERKTFLDTIKAEYKDFEKFGLMRDTLLMKKPLRKANYCCFACYNTEHNISKCPWISHQPNTEMVILRYKRSISQQRRLVKRRKKKMNCIKNHRSNVVGAERLARFYPSINEPCENETENPVYRIDLNGETTQLDNNSPDSEPDRNFHHSKTMEKINNSVNDDESSHEMENSLVLPISPGKPSISFSDKKKPAAPQKHKINIITARRLPSEEAIKKNEVKSATYKRKLQKEECEESTSKMERNSLTDPDKETNHSKSPLKINMNTASSKFEPLFLPEFDRMHSWNIYFPHNNSEKIIPFLINFKKTSRRKTLFLRKMTRISSCFSPRKRSKRISPRKSFKASS